MRFAAAGSTGWLPTRRIPPLLPMLRIAQENEDHYHHRDGQHQKEDGPGPAVPEVDRVAVHERLGNPQARVGGVVIAEDMPAFCVSEQPPLLQHLVDPIIPAKPH